MLTGKVLASSALLLLLVVLAIGQDTDEQSIDADEVPVEKRETTEKRSYGQGSCCGGKLSIEDIDGPTCAKLLVSGDAPRPDSSISASSQWDANHGPKRARIYRTLQGHLRGAWSSRHNNINQWLKFDLGQIRTVTGVMTKGRSQQAEQFVKSYWLLYSNDGTNWVVLKNQHGLNRVFRANFDGETPKVNTLYPPIRARYIRFNPRTWYGHISMRADVLGCL